MVMINRRGTLPGLGGMPLDRVQAKLQLPLARVAERRAASAVAGPRPKTDYKTK